MEISCPCWPASARKHMIEGYKTSWMTNISIYGRSKMLFAQLLEPSSGWSWSGGGGGARFLRQLICPMCRHKSWPRMFAATAPSTTTLMTCTSNAMWTLMCIYLIKIPVITINNYITNQRGHRHLPWCWWIANEISQAVSKLGEPWP